MVRVAKRESTNKNKYKNIIIITSGLGKQSILVIIWLGYQRPTCQKKILQQKEIVPFGKLRFGIFATGLPGYSTSILTDKTMISIFSWKLLYRDQDHPKSLLLAAVKTSILSHINQILSPLIISFYIGKVRINCSELPVEKGMISW